MSETNESGNRWEKKPVEDADQDSAVETPAATADPIEVPAATEVAAPVAASPRPSRVPRWVTTRGLVTTAAAAAIFLGGGGVGYAIGANHDDGRGQFPGRFDRADFDGRGPGGQGPGGQFPGTGQQPGGQSFQGDDSGAEDGASS